MLFCNWFVTVVGVGVGTCSEPVGIMLEAAGGDDLRLLSIALAVETLIGEIPAPDLP